MSAVRRRPLKRLRSERGLTTAPESRCDPGCLPFSSTATGTSPSRSATSGASSSSCPSRIAQARPAGPAPTIRTPTSIRSSSGSLGAATNSDASKGGGKSAGRSAVIWQAAAAECVILERVACSRGLALSDELGQLRDDLVQVADDPEVGVLEDRRVRVLVDRDDHARALHPDLVLDRARDADGDVEPRRDALPRLADLGGVRIPARVDHGAGGPDRAAERARERLDERESLGSPEPAAARDDHVRFLDRRALRLLDRLLDELDARRALLELDLELPHLRRAAAALHGV